MAFELPPLPYAEDALEPAYSARTISFHYGKHHKTYVDTLNKLVAGTDLEGKSLEDVIMAVDGKPEKQPVFNNAAQVWNHTFFWNGMKPGAGCDPAACRGRVGARLLPRLPEPASRLHADVFRQARQLGLRGGELGRGEVAEGRSSTHPRGTPTLRSPVGAGRGRRAQARRPRPRTAASGLNPCSRLRRPAAGRRRRRRAACGSSSTGCAVKAAVNDGAIARS